MKNSRSQDISEFESRYREEFRPCYEKFAARLHHLLVELTGKAGIPVDKIEYRVKTVESFLEKVERKSPIDSFTAIKDCAGVRIITYYPDDVEKVKDIIHNEFEVDKIHSEDKLTLLGAEEFGYRSVHFVVTLAESRKSLKEWEDFVGLPAEIQVRSILQHSWATMSHEFDYKRQSQVPEKLRRRLFRLSALLEVADEEFMTLRDLSEGIAEEYRTEVSQGKLDLPLNLDSLREFMSQKIDLQYWEQCGVHAGMESFPQLISKSNEIGLEILLLTLQTVGISTIAEFEGVLSGFEPLAACLQRFVNLIKSNGKTVHAVPVDVLILLVSLSKTDAIPTNFDWGGKYEPFFIEALHKVCKQVVRS